MHRIICPNPPSQAKACAALIAAQVLRKPHCVLGLATGSTPIETYEELIALYKAGALDFSHVRTFNLDEYVGLPITHAESYYSFMWKHLFSQIGMRPEQVRIPNGNAPDLAAECASYEREIAAAGGIDLQLLGLGHDGHIAFNEPEAIYQRVTHVAELNPITIEANKRFFASADEVPRRALTMGIGSIMAARSIVLAASGTAKAEIVHRAFQWDVTPQIPASILQFHPNCTIVLDEAAASKLTK